MMKKLIDLLTCLFIALCVGFLLTGCISSKKLSKHNTKRDTSFVDKSVVNTVVTEKVDTIVYTKADTTTFSLPTTDTTSVVINTPTTYIKAKYNPRTKHVDVVAIDKPKPVHVFVDKKTEVQDKKHIEVKGSKEDKGKELDKSTFSLPLWLWLLIGLLLLLWLFYKYYLKKQFPFLP